MFALLFGMSGLGAVDCSAEDAPPPPPKGDPAGLDVAGPLFAPNSYLAGWGSSVVDEKGAWKPYADPENPTPQELSKNIAHSFISTAFVWTLICGFLVMFMQAGFALVEAGFCRAKNAVHTMGMNFMVYAIGMTGFFLTGFALMCGGVNGTAIGGPGALGGVPVLNSMAGVTVGGTMYGLFGTKGFMLTGTTYDAAVVVWFLFMMVFMDTTATIPTGALAERWKFSSFAIFSLLIGGFLYPIYGCWVWGGGWLAQLGLGAGLGHGAVDFAGSSVVHLQGGVLALVLAIMVGPRIGKYTKEGKPIAILGHNIPMAVLGTFILAFGWFGFNAGSALAGTDGRIGMIAVNTMLASASGAIASFLFMRSKTGKVDVPMICNGMLAGLVAITAPCAFVQPWAAFLIGIIAGVIVVISCLKIEAAGIDDPVGAISVHGTNGLWGLLALGLFADGSYGAGFNGVGYSEYLGAAGQGVTGLFYGDASQFYAQCIAGFACIAWNAIAGGLVFWLVGILCKGNRVPEAVEIAGLDYHEMGTPAYAGFVMEEDVFKNGVSVAVTNGKPKTVIFPTEKPARDILQQVG